MNGIITTFFRFKTEILLFALLVLVLVVRDFYPSNQFLAIVAKSLEIGFSGFIGALLMRK